MSGTSMPLEACSSWASRAGSLPSATPHGSRTIRRGWVHRGFGAAFVFLSLVATYHPEFMSTVQWGTDAITSCAVGATSVVGTLVLRRLGQGVVVSAGVASLAGIVSIFVVYLLLAMFARALCQPSSVGVAHDYAVSASW